VENNDMDYLSYLSYISERSASIVLTNSFTPHAKEHTHPCIHEHVGNNKEPYDPKSQNIYIENKKNNIYERISNATRLKICFATLLFVLLYIIPSSFPSTFPSQFKGYTNIT
jgi:hypothetical protein